jgi:hypothetical protein
MDKRAIKPPNILNGYATIVDDKCFQMGGEVM